MKKAEAPVSQQPEPEEKKKRRRRRQKKKTDGENGDPTSVSVPVAPTSTSTRSTVPQPHPAPAGPRRAEPITLDLGAVLQKVKAKKLTKREKEEKRRAAAPKHPKAKSSLRTIANPLDSTAPRIRRGKEREKPKAKKLTRLKKLILAERARKAAFNKAVKDLKWDDAQIEEHLVLEPPAAPSADRRTANRTTVRQATLLQVDDRLTDDPAAGWPGRRLLWA